MSHFLSMSCKTVWEAEPKRVVRSEEHTSELHHGYISYAVFCLKKKKKDRRASDSHPSRVSYRGPPRVPGATWWVISLLARGSCLSGLLFFFFFNDTATTEIYTLSLHDALPISW